MINLKHFAKTKKEELKYKTFLLFLVLLLQVFVKDWLNAYLLSKMLIVLKQNNLIHKHIKYPNIVFRLRQIVQSQFYKRGEFIDIWEEKVWKCTSKTKKQSNKNSFRTMKRRDRKHWKDLCPSRDFQWFHGDFRTLPCFAFTRNDERNAIDLSGVAFPKKCFISMWQCVSSEGTEELLFFFCLQVKNTLLLLEESCFRCFWRQSQDPPEIPFHRRGPKVP
jgi:hypothetical protein